jgi:hypothetical protein
MNKGTPDLLQPGSMFICNLCQILHPPNDEVS